jgi:hypothetical protein
MSETAQSRCRKSEVDGVSKRFSHRVKGDVYAARNVRFTRRRASSSRCWAIWLRKTTTLRMIAGFEQPDEAASARQRRRHARAREPARHRLRLSELCVVSAPVRVRQCRVWTGGGGESAHDVAARVGDVLALVGLTGYEHQFFGAAFRRRAAARRARGIVIHPRVLLFDERCRTSTRSCACRCVPTSANCSAGLRSRRSTSRTTRGSDGRIRPHRRDEPGTIVQEGTAEDHLPSPCVRIRRNASSAAVNLVPGMVFERTATA